MSEQTTAAHTPGPWQAHARDEDGQHFIRMGEAVEVRNGYQSHQVIEYEHGLYPEDGAQYDEADANARLIAAAPDLYTACLAMLDALYGPLECTHGNDGGDEDICDGCAFKREKARGLAASDMRAAINKAEGRQ